MSKKNFIVHFNKNEKTILEKKPIERCLGQKDRACAPSQTRKKKASMRRFARLGLHTSSFYFLFALGRITCCISFYLKKYGHPLCACPDSTTGEVIKN
jgi:hypothetical protein